MRKSQQKMEKYKVSKGNYRTESTSEWKNVLESLKTDWTPRKKQSVTETNKWKLYKQRENINKQGYEITSNMYPELKKIEEIEWIRKVNLKE